MSAKHTPGPWSAVADPYGRAFIVSDSLGSKVAICTHFYHDTKTRKPEEIIGNQTLIAAAPDLLDAVQGLLEVFVDSDTLSGCEDMESVKVARAAIAKAEGRA